MSRPRLAGLAAIGLACALASPAKADPKGPGELFRDPGLAGPRDGDVIVEQAPSLAGGPGADTLFLNDYGQIVWQQVADDILLDTPATARRVQWYGFYGGYQQNHQPPAGDETMRIRFYSARTADGLPGDLLYEETFLNPSRSPTGRMLDLFVPEFGYHAGCLAGLQ